MARFMNHLYENAANVPHVITICSIWISDGRDYCATSSKVEVVNRIFRVVSRLNDSSCRDYAIHLKSALLPFYHTLGIKEESSISDEEAFQFIKSVNERVIELREKQGEPVF